MRISTQILTLVVLTSLVVSAAGIWDKPFTEWSDKDVDKVLTDSPWAGKASLTHARVGTNLGPVPDWPLLVTVRTALPYKEAQIRKQVVDPGSLTAEQKAALTVQEPLYVIAIAGIPRMFMPQATAIAQAAMLKRPHKDGLKPREARILLFDKDGKQVDAPPPLPPPVRGGDAADAPAPAPAAGGGGGRGGRGGGFGGGFGGGSFDAFPKDKSGITATLFLGFPKDDPIAVDEGEVELSTTIAFYNVSKKFKLKDMTVNGMLAF